MIHREDAGVSTARNVDIDLKLNGRYIIAATERIKKRGQRLC